jgi:hypothetical protein
MLNYYYDYHEFIDLTLNQNETKYKLMKVFGDKSTFAFEIEEYTRESKNLRIVNIFVDRRNICCDDNTVYVPSFVNSLYSSANYLKKKIDYIKFEKFFFDKSVPEAHEFIKSTQDINSLNHQILGGEIYSFHQFLDWGTTTDNVTSFLIPIDGFLFLTCQFWRTNHHPEKEINVVFGAIVTPYQLIQTIEYAIDELKL